MRRMPVRSPRAWPPPSLSYVPNDDVDRTTSTAVIGHRPAVVYVAPRRSAADAVHFAGQAAHVGDPLPHRDQGEDGEGGEHCQEQLARQQEADSERNDPFGPLQPAHLTVEVEAF